MKDFKSKHFQVFFTSDGAEIQASYPDTSGIFVPQELWTEFAEVVNQLSKGKSE